MRTLDGVNIAVGITGCIAAYKAADVVSKLGKLGANVKVVMTKEACEFVTPLTFGTLSKNKVICDMFALPDYSEVEHVSLADWADVFLICPATANIIGKIACGIADDFLTTAVMAYDGKVVFAPAMNDKMYKNPIVQKNIEHLANAGYEFIEPEDGMLACGTSGKGRLAEPMKIVETIERIAFKKKDLAGKNVLITAGPTQEAIDPVRFITNHSSGKMGYAAAKAAKLRGANVTLVSGEVSLEPFVGINLMKVKSAEQMCAETLKLAQNADIVIKSAAVADYRPAQVCDNKIKKGGEMSISLVENPDILKELGKNKGNTILVGFCMETQNLLENAEKKLKSKNLDMIVANDLSKEGAGFKGDTNIVTFIRKNGTKVSYDIMEKEKIAHIILDECVKISCGE